MKVATSSQNEVLSERLEVTAGVPNWSMSEYCTLHERILGACRILGTFSDG